MRTPTYNVPIIFAPAPKDFLRVVGYHTTAFLAEPHEKLVEIAHHLEGGYGYVRPLEYEVIDGKAPTVGDLDFRGFTIRFGTGGRF